MSRLRCPHCGFFDWERAPGLRKTLTFIEGRAETTNEDIVRKFKVSTSNAANQLLRLTELGLVALLRSEPHPNGGVRRIYHAVRKAPSHE